jgi:phage portal protein BeeE
MSVDARLHVRATRCAGHHRTPLLDQAAVERPGAWRWAARLRRTVLLLVGARLGLDSDSDDAEAEPARRRARLARAAAVGALIGGAVPYRE